MKKFILLSSILAIAYAQREGENDDSVPELNDHIVPGEKENIPDFLKNLGKLSKSPVFDSSAKTVVDGTVPNDDAGKPRTFGSSGFLSPAIPPTCTNIGIPSNAKWCFSRCERVPWYPGKCRSFYCLWKPKEAYTKCGTKVEVHPNPANGKWQIAAYCRRPNRPCYDGFCSPNVCKAQALEINGYCPKKRCTQLYKWKLSEYYVKHRCDTRWDKKSVWFRIPFGCSCKPSPPKQCRCRQSNPFSLDFQPVLPPWLSGDNNFDIDGVFPNFSSC